MPAYYCNLIMLFLFFHFFKIQHISIYAITQAGWWWAIFKNVTQMRFTTAAHYFCSLHTIAIVWCIYNTSFCYRLKEAGPATAAVELPIAFKQWITTSATVISACIKAIPVFTCKRPFCALFPCNAIQLLWQNLFPLFIAKIYFTGVCVGVNTTLLFFFTHSIAFNLFCLLRLATAKN